MVKTALKKLVIDRNNPLSRLSTVKILQKLEVQYKNHLHGIPKDIKQGYRLYKRLNRLNGKVNAFIKKDKKVAQKHSTEILQVLEAYQSEFNLIHQQNIEWLCLYLSACLDHDMSVELSKEFRYKRINSCIRKTAKGVIAEMKLGKDRLGLSDKEGARLLYLNEKYKDVHLSVKKRTDYNDSFIEQVKQGLRRTYRQNQYRLRYLFKTLLYSQSSINQLAAQGSVQGEPQKRLIERVKEFVRDCLYGYTPKSTRAFDQADTIHQDQVYKDVLQLERIIQFKRIKKSVIIAVSLLMAGYVLNVTGLDYHLMRTLKLAARDVMSIKWIFHRRDQKASYFEKEILKFNMDVSKDNLKTHLNKFIYGGMYKAENKYYLFSEFLLKDYMVLLAKREVDAVLENEMYRAGFLLNPEIVENLETLNYLYKRKIILESDLRQEVLSIRRLFVRNNVYPFMFLVLYENTPYIFVYNEKIIKTMELKEDDVKQLGFDSFWFEEVDQRLLKAYFMSGDEYPFSGKSGFFEGEFAVVFTSLSTRPNWTAWHELGHVVDYMQYTHGGIMVPVNVEVNAVLFPLVYADDPKVYILKHVFSLIRRKDRKDYYVQSAKGILNGAIIYLNEVKGAGLPLITNRFEDAAINKIEAALMKLNDEQLRALGVNFYRNQRKYLATAEKARYRTVATNTEEIIYGVHGSPQREVIEVKQIGSLFGSSDGPRFIRDGDGPQDDSAALRRAAIIRAAIVFVLFEILAVLLHLLASPIRHIKFHGRKPLKIIAKIFRSQKDIRTKNKNHVHSAHEILISIYDSSYDKGEIFQKKIDLFRLTSNTRERFLFHAGLCIAPTIPQRSIIKNELHLLLFYLPFLGPFLARLWWIFPKQRPFHYREQFNKKIRNLITRSPQNTPIHALSDRLDKIMQQYELSQASGDSAKKSEIDFAQIEQWVLGYLEKVLGSIRLNYEGRWMDLSRFNKKIDKGTEYDRLDKYHPGDDVRMIDWNVTARSTTQEAMVRKRIQDEDVQVAFLFDMTTLNTTINRKKWASDLAKSIRAVGENNHLKTIIFLYPDGKHIVRQIKLHSKLHSKQLAVKLIAIVKQQIAKSSDQLNISSYRGLKFYSDEENQRYRQQLNWLSYDFMDQQTTLGHIRILNHTIFMIGVKPQKKKLISHVLNKKNKAVFW